MKNKEGLTFGKRLKIYIRKNAFALAVSGCAILLVVALAVTAIIRSNQSHISDIDPFSDTNTQTQNEGRVDSGNDTPTFPVSSDDVITFVMPVKNYQVGTAFVNDNVVFNETMNEWTTHVGVDFVTDGAQDVCSIADGVIENIEYSALEGTIITIKHSDELKSVYKSLANDISVNVGDGIKAGDVIGKTSASAGSEAKLGMHLHLEVLENGKNVNPFDYLSDK